MATASDPCVILFGDSSLDTFDDAVISDLTSNNKLPLLHRLLCDVEVVLRKEYAQLTPPERAMLPISDVAGLLHEGNSKERKLHPALAAAKLVLVQLASFISSYEKRPHERYPRSSTDLIIGLCLGQLSAAAVTCATSLHELVPVAVEAVRLAFRVGNITHKAALEIDGWEACNKSWSTVISKDRGISDDTRLEKYQQDLDIPLRNKAYISASSRKNVTISGPPSTLQKIFNELENSSCKTKPYRLPIYSPYHAPHLYSADSSEELLTSSDMEELPIRYCHNIELFENALREILIERFEWEQYVENCSNFISASEARKWSIRAFGPTSSPKSLVSAINLPEGRELAIDDSFTHGFQSTHKSKRPPLAIVGMAGRFPQASSPDELWKLLMERIDCHTPIPESRFNPSTHLSQPAYGCFLDSPGSFDAKFFNMSPREALQTDPGQRLALVTAYEALEMAGFVPNRTPSTKLERIGTFYGQTVDEYKEQNMPQNVDTYFIPGSLRAFGPGRINRYFKFGGPASSLDTACSSSAVAFNTACNSVWDGECTMAVVGGINILTGSDNYNGLIAGHFLSPTGGCKTFDDSADGYCRAEAVASLVLKRLDDAEADSDNILGVILSAATNYSANSVSITRPHNPTQQQLYTRVLGEAGIQASDIDYIEMHGTGTQAGDGCEISSVAEVFASTDPDERRDRPLYVSAVKPNIGHSEAASGITSIMKALLVLREHKLPPHIGIKSSINRGFPDLEGRNVVISTGETELPQLNSSNTKFRVLVNNFGAAGGNTAVIIEAPTIPRTQRLQVDGRPEHIVNITANSKISLMKNIENMIKYLDYHADVSLSDLSYTTTARRIQQPLRVSTVASSLNGLRASLLDLQQSTKIPTTPNKVSKIVFAFTGQGSLYCSLGKGLFQTSPLFRSYLIRLDEIAKNHGFQSFLRVIDGSETLSTVLTASESQLAITAVQIALCQIWAAWGVEPGAVIGHSLGEYAALYASGVLTISDTIYLVGKRAELLEKLCQPKTHAMLALRANQKSSRTLVEETGLEIACINGPSDFVLSGPLAQVENMYNTFKSKGSKATLLEIAYGFHSSQVDPILDGLENLARGVNFRRPRIPVMSPVLNKVVEEECVFNPTYLRRHAREPVNFCGALETARNSGIIDENTVWLEIGPHPLCLSMIKATLGPSILEVASFRKNENSCSSVPRAASVLCSYGVDINWQGFHDAFGGDQKLLVLPSYAWEEKDYWMKYENDWVLNKKPIQKGENANGQTSAPVLKGPSTTSVQKLLSEEMKDGHLNLLFESDLADHDLHGAIIGHLVNGAGLCPASIYADMALTAANYAKDTRNISVPISGIDVACMNIFRPIVVSKNRDEVTEKLRLSVVGNLETGEFRCRFGSYQPENGKTEWKADCMVTYTNADVWLKSWDKLTYLIRGRIDSLEAGVSKATTHKLFQPMVYRLFKSCVDYDMKYQAMKEVLMKSIDLEASATLDLYSGSEGGKFFCSPFWIDAIVHLAGFVMNTNETTDNRDVVWISGGWGSMQFAEPINSNSPYIVYVKMIPVEQDTVLGDVYVMQDDKIVAKIGDLNFHRLPRAILDRLFRVSSPPSDRQREAPKRVSDSGTVKPLEWSDRPKAQLNSEAPNWVSDKVLQCIADEVNVSIDELLQIDEFEKAGIDSLMSLQILSKISTTLDIDLDPDIFQSLATVQKLRAHLADLYLDCPDSEIDSSSTGGGSPSLPVTPYDHDDRLPNDDRWVALLVSTISEELGVDVEELERHAEDLSALGLDSLMGFTVISSLEEKFGIEIETSDLPEKVTLSSLKSLVGKRQSTFATPGTHELDCQQKRENSKIPLSVILRGNPASAARLAFFFPDGSGSAGVYQGVRMTSSDLCLVGLNSPFLKQPEQYTCTIDALVRTWVTEIRSRQARGPYYLIGYSAGAYYAFEAVKQLMEEGETISRLVLIDSPCRTRYGAMPTSVLDYLQDKSFASHCQSREQNSLDSSPTHQDLVRRHFTATIRTVREYSAKPISYGPPTTLIWASDGVAKDMNSCPNFKADSSEAELFIQWLFYRQGGKHDADGWELLIRNSRIHTEVVRGNHFSITKPGNVESLSRIIEKALLG